MPQPYWVQIECQPSGNKTMCMQIDLTLVKRLIILRENDVPSKIMFKYDGLPQEMSIEGYGVDSFLKYWDEYTPVSRKDEPAKAGVIHIAGTQSVEGLN